MYSEADYLYSSQWCARWYKHQQGTQGNEGDASDVDVCRQLKIKLSINVNIPVINLHLIHFRNILTTL